MIISNLNHNIRKDQFPEPITIKLDKILKDFAIQFSTIYKNI